MRFKYVLNKNNKNTNPDPRTQTQKLKKKKNENPFGSKFQNFKRTSMKLFSLNFYCNEARRTEICRDLPQRVGMGGHVGPSHRDPTHFVDDRVTG